MIVDLPSPELCPRSPLHRLVASVALSLNSERVGAAVDDPFICSLRIGRTAEALSHLFGVEVEAINLQPMQMPMPIIKATALDNTYMLSDQETVSIVMGQRAILKFEKSDLPRWQAAGLIEKETFACSPCPSAWLTALLKHHTPLTAPVEIAFDPLTSDILCHSD